MPLRQAVQAIRPVRLAKVLGAHGAHCVAPLSAEAVPRPQKRQAALPFPDAYDPGKQAEQKLLFAAACAPGGHALHTVTLPPGDAVPAGQTLHAVALATLPGAQLYCAAAPCSSSSNATSGCSRMVRRVAPTASRAHEAAVAISSRRRARGGSQGVGAGAAPVPRRVPAGGASGAAAQLAQLSRSNRGGGACARCQRGGKGLTWRAAERAAGPGRLAYEGLLYVRRLRLCRPLREREAGGALLGLCAALRARGGRRVVGAVRSAARSRLHNTLNSVQRFKSARSRPAGKARTTRWATQATAARTTSASSTRRSLPARTTR